MATCDPQKLSVIDELRSFLGYDIRPVVATEQEILAALDRFYGASGGKRQSDLRHGGRHGPGQAAPSSNGPTGRST